MISICIQIVIMYGLKRAIKPKGVRIVDRLKGTKSKKPWIMGKGTQITRFGRKEPIIHIKDKKNNYKRSVTNKG